MLHLDACYLIHLYNLSCSEYKLYFLKHIHQIRSRISTKLDVVE